MPNEKNSPQDLYYPEAHNKAKFIMEESLRPDEDALDTIDLVDFFVDHEQEFVNEK